MGVVSTMTDLPVRKLHMTMRIPRPHVPSLSHLRDFARLRARGAKTHVALDKAQVQAPSTERFFAFAYEKLISALISYVSDGNRGPAMARAVAQASDRMRKSYTECAKGIEVALGSLRPSSATRRQRSVQVLDRDGLPLVSVRVHVFLDCEDVRHGVFIYFSERALTEVERQLVETAVSLAVNQLDPAAVPTILLARSGEVYTVSKAATSDSRLSFLRSTSVAYGEEWDLAA